MQPVIVVIGILVVAALIYKLLTRQRIMSPEQFAKAVLKRINEAHPGVSVKETDGFSWIIETEDEPKQVFLDNTYARYCQLPDHFNEIVDNMINAFSSMQDTTDINWEDAKPNLFPSLKTLQYIECTRQLPGGAAAIDNLVMCDWKYNLKILIALDCGMTMSFVNLDQMNKWGVSKDELLQISVDNLSKLTAQHWVEATRLAQENGLFAFAVNDGYDASRILLPDFYERASRTLGSDRLLVGIPNRDMLVAISADAPHKDNISRQVRTDAENYDHPLLSDMISLS